MSKIIHRNIVPVNMLKPLQRDYVGVLLASDDNLANVFGVTVEGVASLSGYAVLGYFMRQDESDTLLLTGSISGNEAIITLDAACYAKTGFFNLAIKLCATDGTISTVRIVDGYIRQTKTDVIYDPGEVVPSLDEMLAKIEACEEARVGAETAQGKAEEAQEAAETAQSKAETAKRGAEAAAASILLLEAEATTLAPGSEATATYDPVKGVMSFGIPRGDKGDSGGSASANAVSPEMYGALGDGENDDAPALKTALESGQPVVLTQDLWLKSDIIITDCNVEMDGQGHTIHCDKAGITIRAGTWTDGTHGECSQVSNTVQSDYDADRSPYYRGYLTYKGRQTLQETYESSTVTYWDIYSANLRNFTMDCENGDYGNGKGVVALSLYRMCDSVIDNVSTLLHDGAEGAVGILVAYGQNVRVMNCYSRGWVCANNRATDNRGYGYQLHGDNVTISNCSGEQCKHIISVGSVKNCWSTNITIDHCTFRTDFQKADPPTADGSQWYMEQIDVHGDAHNVTITGCNHYWWALDGNTQSASIILLRNPTTVMSNCNIYSNGGWVSFGEMAEKMYIDQLHAPNVHLTTDARISGDHNNEHFMPELHVSNSEFARLRDSRGPTRVYMTGCTIREYIIDVQYLIARGCNFMRETSWAAQPTMVLLGESILSDCIIYGHRENSISGKTPIIRAPEKSVHMSNCKIYKRQGGYLTFDTEQDEGIGNRYEDVFAFYLNTQCELDKNTLH